MGVDNRSCRDLCCVYHQAHLDADRPTTGWYDRLLKILGAINIIVLMMYACRYICADSLFQVNAPLSPRLTSGGDISSMQVIIFGDAGDSGPLALESSANDFEKGNRDVFFVRARNVGTIQAIKV